MKKKIISLAMSIFLIGSLTAQEKFTVPQLTQEQKQEVLYSHVMAYCVSGISMAKNQGLTPQEYGEYTGKLFTAYWDPAGGFPMFANQVMFILAGMHPDNQMEITDQSEKSLTFRLKNVDYSFQNGPMFGISYQDMLDFSDGLLQVIAKHMGVDFKAETKEDGWYIVYMKAK